MCGFGAPLDPFSDQNKSTNSTTTSPSYPPPLQLSLRGSKQFVDVFDTRIGKVEPFLWPSPEAPTTITRSQVARPYSRSWRLPSYPDLPSNTILTLDFIARFSTRCGRVSIPRAPPSRVASSQRQTPLKGSAILVNILSVLQLIDLSRLVWWRRSALHDHEFLNQRQ